MENAPATLPARPAQAPAPIPEEAGYTQATLRAFASSWKWWTAFCRTQGHTPAPPFDIELIKDAVTARVAEGKARATIDALLHTLSAVSSQSGHPCPTHSESFRKWIRGVRRRSLTAHQEQAKGMTYPALLQILSKLDKRKPADARDGAILTTAFDGLLRSNEVASLRWADLERAPDGSATILLRRSKTDQEGRGKQIYLTPETCQWIDAWAIFAESSQAVFHALRHGGAPAPLDTRSIRRIFALRGAAAGIPGLSGHSARVGAAQDATAANVPLQAVMVAGRWTNPKMPAKYGEKASVQLLGAERLDAIREMHARRSSSS